MLLFPEVLTVCPHGLPAPLPWHDCQGSPVFALGAQGTTTNGRYLLPFKRGEARCCCMRFWQLQRACCVQ